MATRRKATCNTCNAYQEVSNKHPISCILTCRTCHKPTYHTTSPIPKPPLVRCHTLHLFDQDLAHEK